MLVITRKTSDSIVIRHDGEEFAVNVLEVKGDKVRLGLAGPQTFQVVRAELVRKERDAA